MWEFYLEGGWLWRISRGYSQEMMGLILKLFNWISLIKHINTNKKQGEEKLAKEMFEMQRKKDSKGMSAQQIHKGFISKRDKTFLNDIIETLEPFGLPEK